MMKKLSQIVTAALVAALIVYAAAVALTAPVLPPVRMAGEYYITYYGPPKSFPELVKDADVIAHIRIGDWLGVDSHLSVANFEATAVEVYKGELPKKFVVAQSGDLESRFHTWFTYGNEAFLFLKIPEGEYDHENTYRITDERTIAYIAYNDSGDAHIVPYGSDVFRSVPGADAYKVIPELRGYLAKNDPELWSDRPVGSAYRLDRVVAVFNEILTKTRTEPPEVSISVGGETLALEPREFSWTTQSGEYESPNAAHPLLLSDDEWNALPCLDGTPSGIEFLCDIEPSSIRILGFHESYRGVDEPANTILVQRLYVHDDNEDGIFEIDSSSGYVYVASVSWNENSESPRYRGSAQYAFRVGKTKEIAPEQVALSSFDAYPTPQLSNALVGVPRSDILAQFGEPDIAQEDYDLWLSESGKYVRVRYQYPEYGSVFLVEASLGLPVFPPLNITIGGETHPVRQGTTTWQYTIEGKRGSGFELDSSAPEDWDWSETTIYTDATEAVITLDVSERLAGRMDVSIDGGLISAETVGETFELPGGSAKIYEFRVYVGDAAAEGSDSLFSGSCRCAVRIAPSGDRPQ